MRTRPFGPSGYELAVVGLGTWHLEQADAKEAVRAIRRGIALGANHVDTAEMYGHGRVEELVGEAIVGHRDEVVLVSKVMPQNASRKGTITACEASLRRLRTDRLDGYLLHWEGPHPLEDTFAAFEELVSAGKIRWWGVSNFDEALLARSVTIAGPGRVVCDQVLYHLKERAIEHRVIPACREHGVAIVGYSPFGSGDFPEPSSAAGRVLAAVAERHGATPRQVGLAFLTRDPDLFTIPKASRVGHVEKNVAAGDLVLTPEDVAEIDRAFPRGPVKPLPMI